MWRTVLRNTYLLLEVNLPLSSRGTKPAVKSPRQSSVLCCVCRIVFTWGFQWRGWLSSSIVLHTDQRLTRGTPRVGPAALGGWQTGPETEKCTAHEGHTARGGALSDTIADKKTLTVSRLWWNSIFGKIKNIVTWVTMMGEKWKIQHDLKKERRKNGHTNQWPNE